MIRSVTRRPGFFSARSASAGGTSTPPISIHSAIFDTSTPASTYSSRAPDGAARRGADPGAVGGQNAARVCL